MFRYEMIEIYADMCFSHSQPMMPMTKIMIHLKSRKGDGWMPVPAVGADNRMTSRAGRCTGKASPMDEGRRKIAGGAGKVPVKKKPSLLGLLMLPM